MLQEALFYDFSFERHIPDNHLLRKIDRFVDLSGLRRIWGRTIAMWDDPRSIPS